jgi:tripartite-type tricarboxylate transporter receptor subunit TctC
MSPPTISLRSPLDGVNQFDIIAVINKETNSALADAKIKTQLETLGNTVLPGSPADFGALIAEETDKWAKGVKFADIKPQ